MREKASGRTATPAEPTARALSGARAPNAAAESRAERQLFLLARMSSSVSSTAIDESLAAIAEAAGDGLGWESASVRLLDAGGRLSLKAARPSGSESSATPSLRSDAATIQRVLSGDAPILLEPPSGEDADALGLKSGFARVIAAPLRADSQPAGILTAATRNGASPQSCDLSFFAALAAKAGEAVAYHNLLDAHGQACAELEAVHQVSLRASGATLINETLNAALDAIRRLLDVPMCAIYEVVEPGARLRCRASLNVPASLIQAIETHSVRALAQMNWREGVAVAIQSPEEYPGDPRVAGAALGTSIRAGFVFPIFVGGEAYGALSLYDSKPRAWTATEARTAELLAGVIAGALSRVRAYEDAVQAADQLRELHQISVKLLGLGDPSHVAMAATEAGRNLLRADVVAIQAYDRRYRLLKLLAAHPSDTECLPVVTPIGRGVSGKALEQMRAVVRPIRLTRAGFTGFEAAIPLRGHPEPMGVLAVFREEKGGAFRPDEIEFAELFATIVAAALNNAHLLGRSEELGVLTERNRIATEMHDSVGDNLAALLMKAELMQSALDSDTQRARRELDWMAATLKQSIVEMRRILRALKPVDLEQMGLLAAIRKVADDYSHNCGIPIVLHSSDTLPRLGRQADYALYRVVNESLNNARKYAGATAVTITLRADAKQFMLVVEDNGRGFDPGDIAEGRGLGLRGLTDSVRAVGGRLDIDAAPGKGTRIAVSFPLFGAV